MKIEVNGRIYVKREKPIRSNPKLAQLMMANQMISRGMIAHDPKSNSKVMKSVCDDVVEEFGKVERKESRLSSAQRKVVIAEFFNQYELTDEIPSWVKGFENEEE